MALKIPEYAISNKNLHTHLIHQQYLATRLYWWARQRNSNVLGRGPVFQTKYHRCSQSTEINPLCGLRNNISSLPNNCRHYFNLLWWNWQPDAHDSSGANALMLCGCDSYHPGSKPHIQNTRLSEISVLIGRTVGKFSVEQDEHTVILLGDEWMIRGCTLL